MRTTGGNVGFLLMVDVLLCSAGMQLHDMLQFETNNIPDGRRNTTSLEAPLSG